MIKLSGVLTIRIITGRHGDFRVGRLVTDIGEFAVKDAVLDQYDEGNYEGDFGVRRIFPSYYSAGGRLVVEVRAELSAIALSGINPLVQQETLLEQDPLDEDKARTEVVKTDADLAGHDTGSELAVQSNMLNVTLAQTDDSGANQDDQDAQLFGLLWPLSDPIKLDPTVDRNRFRQQRDRLKALGYCFKPVGQRWVKP